ncbi:hypothetical protein [Paracraurococcus ruber]|uniref:hypothetical protein n=1 Tax=Paracraurococcus ruber TaxID=77675 RepID=UPI00105766BC|nr:hypothetical protein [Paracraurococcus ruber]TDG30613.1 hypothetical protein E2C05_13865 [Paracraurococcus ruber]
MRIEWAELRVGQTIARVALVNGYRLAVIGQDNSWFWTVSHADLNIASGISLDMYDAKRTVEDVFLTASRATDPAAE